MRPTELEKIEIEYLRKEIEYRTADQAEIEKNVLIGVAIIYVALATLNKTEVVSVVSTNASVLWFLPMFVVLAGMARFRENDKAISKVGRYISEIESQSQSGGGWQASLEKYNSEERVKLENAMFSRTRVFLSDLTKVRITGWIMLIIITFMIPIYINFCPQVSGLFLENSLPAK